MQAHSPVLTKISRDRTYSSRLKVHTSHAFRAFVIFAHTLHEGLEHHVVHKAHNGQLRDGRGTDQKFKRLRHFGFQAHALMLF